VIAIMYSLLLLSTAANLESMQATIVTDYNNKALNVYISRLSCLLMKRRRESGLIILRQLNRSSFALNLIMRKPSIEIPS